MSDVFRFRGRTPGIAMRMAREELGDDARLVNARRVSGPGLPPLYEVQVTPAAEARGGDASALRRELADLREAVDSLRMGSPAVAAPSPAANPETPAQPGALAPWHEALRRGGVGESSTEQVIARAAARIGGDTDAARAGDAVRTALLDLIGDDGDDAPGERSTIVVGPAGAGKTTTLAKIAAERVARGDEPVLVTADGESLSGEDQLQAVSAALGLPFETAFVSGRLEQVVERHGARRICLVDTPGRSPFDGQGLEPMTSIVRALPDAEVLLVLPVGADIDELRSQVDAWAPLRPDRVVLTKLDELARPGRLVDVARAIALPIARVSFGRSARGTYATPRDPRVLARILGTELTVEMTA